MIEFLEALWGNAHGRYGEIRTMKDGQARQDFIDLNDPEWPLWAQARASYMADDDWDVYFGVLPRDMKNGTSAAVYPETQVLWADVDAKRFDGAEPPSPGSKSWALASINAFHTPPSIIVDSGGGYHAYWLLDKPEPLDRAQAVMAHIADQVYGDRVHDAARILRVPGTFNYKKDEPRPVRLLRLATTVRYRLADLEGYLPIPKAAKPKRRPVDGPKEPLPAWLVELIVDGAPQGRRSEQCFRAIVWGIRYGRSYDEIEDLFTDNPTGIGAKYVDKGSDGPRWFHMTYQAAEAVA